MLILSDDMIDVDDSAERTRLVVQGNRSMSWKANLWLAASLGVICFGIAIAMATQGLWMVIPFAGLEVLFIVACLYLTLRRLSRKEVITVRQQAITLEWGYNQADVCVDLPRRWSKLEYVPSASPFDCGELCFAAHGRRYALGRCLNGDEKKTLFTKLESVLAR